MVIQVRVDVRRRAEIAVPQPLLDLLHRDTVGQQEAGAGVPKIMQTDDAQVVLFENPLEAVRQRVRLQPFPDLVHADVVPIVRAVGAPAEPAVVPLLLFFMEQQLPELRHQRKRPHAGFRLGRIGHNLDVLAVKVARRDGMPDRNGIGIEVDGVPLEAEHLAAAQTVEGSQFDGQLQRMALDGLKQRVDLCAVVEAAYKPLLLRALDLVGGIVGDLYDSL